MANLYKDTHNVVKEFSEYNDLGLLLNTETKLKCHYYSRIGFIKAIKLFAAKERSHYVIKVYASSEVLDVKQFETFKALVGSLLTRLSVHFPDVELVTPWKENKVIHYGFAKFTLTNFIDDPERDRKNEAA